MLAAFNMAGESTTATSTVTGSAPENASLLVIEHLRVDFPEVVAVNDLSLRIEAGDVCGLIGPNGAGKTTTMRAVSGLQEFTRGSVRIAGRELAKEPDELKRRLGFMPDFCPTYDQLTTSEFLDHFARAFGVADRARRISECLELTWLTDKRDALCEELSRGMKQRLVLAKTMLPDPQVLLLDEPASGLPAGAHRTAEAAAAITGRRQGGADFFTHSHGAVRVLQQGGDHGTRPAGEIRHAGGIGAADGPAPDVREMARGRGAGAGDFEGSGGGEAGTAGWRGAV